MTTLGPEFGKDIRKTAANVRVLYGLESAGAAFRSHLANCMESFGYQSCKSDPDLWHKLEIIPEDGAQYYSYLLCYVDNILCICHNADAMLDWLHKSFPFKLGFVNPGIDLCAKLHKTRSHDGVWAWVMRVLLNMSKRQSETVQSI